MNEIGRRTVLPKTLTGIVGLDDLTNGGLPSGRTTVVVGSPGAGKTILCLEFLYRGATQYGEPGIYVNFGDPREKILADVRTMNWDLEPLLRDNRLVLADLPAKRAERGQEPLLKPEMLIEAVAYAVKHTGAKRVALDETNLTLPGTGQEDYTASDLKTIMRGIEAQGVTLVMTATGEARNGKRCGVEEYLADCVISLEHRMVNNVASRRLRVLKYRGTSHGAHECPYQITPNGLLILPLSTFALSSAVSEERISTGVLALDHMLDGGYYRESAVLIVGGSGTGKSSLAMACLDAACARGERALYVSYEESPAQLHRNFRSVGMNVENWVGKGLLRLMGVLPEAHGSEEHLTMLLTEIDRFRPAVVACDSFSALQRIYRQEPGFDLPLFLFSEAKNRGITLLATASIANEHENGNSWVSGLYCLADTIISLRQVSNAERQSRGLLVVKSRGMRHDSELRELLITDQGLKLGNVFWNQEEFVLGVSRQIEELRERLDRGNGGAQGQAVRHESGGSSAQAHAAQDLWGDIGHGREQGTSSADESLGRTSVAPAAVA
ncbi:MAG: circadian clock protein KaiC [bacterium]|jgi:circadian clock protein KaiC|nr:circadian clock protein KaiC [candidate division KSB1 bacterium]MDH7558983.1 circadian clock protein KaiC [bacterium]